MNTFAIRNLLCWQSLRAGEDFQDFQARADIQRIAFERWIPATGAERYRRAQCFVAFCEANPVSIDPWTGVITPRWPLDYIPS